MMKPVHPRSAAQVKTKFPHLQSKRLSSYLDDPFFVLDDVRLSRTDLQHISGTPCMRAAATLHRMCRTHSIRTLTELYLVGAAALDRTSGIGERAVWIAATVLYTYGFDVRRWLNSDDVSMRHAIRLIHSKNRRRGKHHAA